MSVIYSHANTPAAMGGESITQSVFYDMTKSVLGGFITGNPIFDVIDYVYTFFTCDCMRKTIEAFKRDLEELTGEEIPDDVIRKNC